jgi:hypothetical protein
MSIRKTIYGLYKKMQRYKLITTAASYAFTRFRKPPHKFLEIPELSTGSTNTPILAFLCDEMTWQDFSLECRAFFVTPQNWKAAFEQYSPAFFFSESAWSGINSYRDSWRGQVYGSENVIYNNRRKLFSILSYCRGNNIPTVFWNKEDPTFFGDKNYNFVDTALQFDIILTTSEECIPQYKALGATHVHLWQFGFPSSIFYPPPEIAFRENKAVFAGGWYRDQPKRCRDLEMLFDTVLAEGIRLVIYNRYSESSNPLHEFPAKYKPFIKPAVHYENLGEIYRRSSYVLNVNTVTDSNTMFARRVFEAMACGCIIVSNQSRGLATTFGGKIWFVGEAFDHKRAHDYRKDNIKMVFNSCSCSHRMNELLDLLR